MVVLFYVSGIIAIIATILVIISNNPIYALLYLIFSLLCTSCNLFSLNASFAGSIEIIIYAGAIMVLFMFSIMMFDMKNIILNVCNKEYTFLSLRICVGASLLISALLIIVLFSILQITNCFIDGINCVIDIKQIGITLFGPYMLIVEVASFLLLSALIAVIHIAQEDKDYVNFVVPLNNKRND